MNTATDLFLGESSKPTFDQIDPRGAGWCEVQVEARALCQPGADGSGVVGAVVIQDQMDFERRGYGLLNGVEKLAELHAAVPAMAGADHRPTLHIERGKQGRRRALVVVTATLGLSRRMGNSGCVRSSA